MKNKNQQVEEQYRQVTVESVRTLGVTGESILILKEKDGNNAVPIWIGILEAQAIAIVLQNVSFPRPLTHDLFMMALVNLGGRIRKVEITGVALNTFFGRIEFEQNGRVFQIDARPSDSIALALRARAPIYIAEKLFLPTTDEEAEQTEDI